uniref:Uncharacterized protein n=1 Tax=Rhodosorus marinus TaxID=101924 RepID=A0A7S3E9X4_9RHOD|mmetsp:Transcript_16994/g.69227  ORF Transcript_16994/g.69227 Transcript_16994/m.69227 type:complete len:136 (+) Transcript_16994:568-975(+)
MACVQLFELQLSGIFGHVNSRGLVFWTFLVGFFPLCWLMKCLAAGCGCPQNLIFSVGGFPVFGTMNKYIDEICRARLLFSSKWSPNPEGASVPTQKVSSPRHANRSKLFGDEDPVGPKTNSGQSSALQTESGVKT